MRNGLMVIHQVHEQVGTIRDHIDALIATDVIDLAKVDIRLAEFVDLSRFSVVVFHYSVVIAFTSYISQRFRDNLRRFHGLKILFIQDEYRFIDQTADAIRDLGVDVVFSLCDQRIVRRVYHHAWCDNVRFEHTLTGYVTPELCRRSVPDYADRPIDVSYRARKLSHWMGQHTFQKWEIAERFMADTVNEDLTLDISIREEDRVYGEAWVDLLSRSKAVLGTESGTSVCDFTGDIQRCAEAYVLENPQASYAEVRDRCFPGVDGRIIMNVISPRCFEAAALRSLMIMYPGDYGGILEPGRHFVLLQRNHSNLGDVLETLRSPVRAAPVIETCYQEVALAKHNSYLALTEHFSTVLHQELPRGQFVSGVPVTRGAARREVEFAAYRREAEAAEAARRAEAEAAEAARRAEEQAKAEQLQLAQAVPIVQLAIAPIPPKIKWDAIVLKAVRSGYAVAGFFVFVIDRCLPVSVRKLIRPLAQSAFRGIRSTMSRMLGQER